METYTYKLVEDEHGNIQCGEKLYRFEETIKYGGYMKIIDLLNKIANGENIKNIKYQNHIYEYYNGDFREEIDGAYDSNWLFANEIIDLSNLNDEIEILEGTLEEEKKIPEKLTHKEERWHDPKDENPISINVRYFYDKEEIGDKINEIIDYLKSKGDE